MTRIRIPPYEWAFRASDAGILATAMVKQEIAEGRADEVRQNIKTVTENIYRRLPSGDYGRGDVRRLIVAVLKGAEEKRWPTP